jgi:long-chain acyl-CoA synthetase
MPGLDAKIFKEIAAPNGRVRLEEQAYGTIGQLYVRGASVFQQYYNVKNGAGAKLISGSYRDDNWLATGDLFSQDQEGFLYFKGRTKDLIKQNGFCIYPRDMESIVYRNHNVEVCQVTGIKDAGENEVAKLFVVLVDNSKEAQIQFNSWLNSHIDHDYMFSEIQYLNQMPLSPNGKVDVSQLTQAA